VTAYVTPLSTGETVRSQLSGDRYVIGEQLGEGGYGAAYRARLGRREVCVKITDHTASWHREAYMAELLHGHSRVIPVLEAFPLVRRRRIHYAIAMELADGTVADAVAHGRWTESKTVNEIRGLLKAVGRLHDSGAVHRDITPFNVFISGRQHTLKLGDFGLAQNYSKKKGVPADAFASWFVHPDIYRGLRAHWTPGDDLWQVGQLAAVLLTGAVWPIETKDVKSLPCSDGLKLAIRRATGEPSERFADAHAMADAFLRRAPLRFGRVRSLRGRTIVFTGPLEIRRKEAHRLARKASARVLRTPSGTMDLLVVGNDSPAWIAGSAGGLKVLKTITLQEQGFPITMIKGNQFLRLVNSKP
jgi:serine/threonine protein kinase